MNWNIDWKKELIDIVKTFLVCFVIVFIFTRFIAKPVQVKGTSMYPTLRDGELGFTNVLALRLEGISRGDVVTAYLASKDESIVKRVIALPGDTISCKDDVVYVNGEALDEFYLDKQYIDECIKVNRNHVFTSDFEEIQLAEDEYFLMGDNRYYSADSRLYGTFKKEDIKSKYIYVWYPIQDVREVK